MKPDLTSHGNTQSRHNLSLRNNRVNSISAVALIASLFFFSSPLSDIAPEIWSAYGITRGGGISGGGGVVGEGRLSGPGGFQGGTNIPSNPGGFTPGGEGRLSGPGGFQGGANIPSNPNIPNNPNIPSNPSGPIIGGETRENFDHGPVGPHGPYGPGPVGPREPRNIDDNTINRNNIYSPRTLEGPVVVNPQPAPTTTETTTTEPSQTEVNITPPATTTTTTPTMTEEEESQPIDSDDGDAGDQSTSTAAQNQLPVANAGPSLTVQPSSNVVLDGTKSYDPNGDPLQFLWLQLAGGTAVPLFNNATATPSFVTPLVSNSTVLTFQLIVSDGQTDSMPAYTYVTVKP